MDLRIRALLKRTQVSDIIRREDVELHVDENRVVKAGQDVPLTLKEWQILLTLVAYEGKTVTRTSLIDEVRGDDDMWEHDGKLDVYISQIRKKLGKEIIETIK
ncbi:MAG: response regulator transcription factor [Candidatus Peribacteria bacterium]|nr:MAG: response regulator transcription factor [Candidatus Peribacteria bacterium]